MTIADHFGPIRGERIAHLIESGGLGGAERMVSELAREQSRNGCAVTVFLPERGDPWLAGQLQGSAVDVEYYQLDAPLSPRCARDIANAFRRRHITLAHSHEFSMAVYGACAARAASIPHIVTMHGGRYYSERVRRRLAMRFALASSQAAVAVSDAAAAQLSADLYVSRGRISVIPNGVRVAPRAVPTLRAELGLANQTPILLAVGNLYPVKGHRYLVEALALLPPELGVHVVIAGRGECEDELTLLAERLGVRDRLHLIGQRADVPNLLASADVFVQPSLSEGLPCALLEAMFAERAVVATDVGDMGAALGEQGGVLVPPGSAQAIADAVGGLLREPARAARLAAAAGRRATDAYGLTTMLERYADLYASLLATRPRRERIERGEDRRREAAPRSDVVSGLLVARRTNVDRRRSPLRSATAGRASKRKIARAGKSTGSSTRAQP